MTKMSDEELFEELRQRIEEKNLALFDLRAVTARLEEVNRRLVESETVKTHFLSNIRNEMVNPLSAIIAFAREIASGRYPDPKEHTAMAAAIDREAFALDFQLRNIFCAASIESGDAVLAPVRIDLERLIADAIEEFHAEAARRSVGLALDCTREGDAEATFRADPGKLHIILANLISNAVKFSDEGGTVRVSCRRDADALELCIHDEGSGISATDQRGVFERFRQLESGRAKVHGGQGLGLSIVRALVDLMGGSVTLESDLDRGSVFCVRLPEAADSEDDVLAEAGNEFIFEEQQL